MVLSTQDQVAAVLDLPTTTVVAVATQVLAAVALLLSVTQPPKE
jgi:hypothetical protein